MSNNINTLLEDGIIAVEGFDIGGSSSELDEVMIKEIVMSENLLTPGLQTFIRLHSVIYKPSGKYFDKWKNKDVTFSLRGVDGSQQTQLDVNQKVYRLEDRHFMPTNVGQTEEMTVHACDESTLQDAKTLISKSWKCTQPSDIVEHVLGKCLKVKNKQVDSADPARDYIAENIHPLQVIAQQANVAVDGDDPSFVHFMTYEDKGKHYFRSLKSMTDSDSAEFTYYQADIDNHERGKDGTGYDTSMKRAINFSFPCDFDYLSDLLNGLDEDGKDQNTGAVFNPADKTFRQLGSSGIGGDECGIGGYNYKQGITNKGTAERQNSCNLDVETHLLKRQARMGLLERDKIALRITVPCNLNLHVGKMLELVWKNKYDNTIVYGSGKYLIASMTHNIKIGGFSVTTMDCVASSVNRGEV